MIIKIPEVFQGIGYFQGISLILWIISAGLLFLAFLLFLLKSSKLEMKSQKMIYLGYGLFGLFFGITRLLFIVAFYISDQYDFYTTLGYITGIIGILAWLYVLETYLVTNTKKIFMIITSIAFAIALIALIGQTSRYLALTMIYILLPFAIIAIFMLYIYLIIKTTGTVRIRAIWLLIGLIILAIGYMMDSELFVGNFPFVPLEIAPLMMILGTLIFMITQLKDL
ncbi:MAG: hypothetical protein ACTSR8_20640 [Promethearchaeota archaeon]